MNPTMLLQNSDGITGLKMNYSNEEHEKIKWLLQSSQLKNKRLGVVYLKQFEMGDVVKMINDYVWEYYTLVELMRERKALSTWKLDFHEVLLFFNKKTTLLELSFHIRNPFEEKGWILLSVSLKWRFAGKSRLCSVFHGAIFEHKQIVSYDNEFFAKDKLRLFIENVNNTLAVCKV